MHQQILKSNMVIQQQERAKHMETIATVLGIISSMLSIFATATSIKNKKEIKKKYAIVMKITLLQQMVMAILR